MKNNDYEKMINIELPNELDTSIQKGLIKGKRNVKIRINFIKATTALAATFVIFVGSINISPAFADSLKDIAIVGTLVKKFQLNDKEVKGGQLANHGKASIALKREGEKEQLVLSFNSQDAGLYDATLNHFPETITISLPGTEKVNVLGDVERSKDASSYIKSIYSLSQDNGNTTYLQIEFEDDADVSIEEYKDPGKIVINLKPGVFEGRDIYSARTLSFAKQEDLDKIRKNIDPSTYRILRDDKYGYFLEFGQFDNKEEADNFIKNSNIDMVVEKRWSNNVPVSFLTKEEYMEEQMMNEYYQVLMNATDIQDILDYLDKHLRQSSPRVQDTLLRGITGYIRDDFEKYDLDKLNNYYKMLGQDIYKQLGLK